MKVQLENVCDFINGGAWSENEYSSSGVPVLKVSNLQKDSIDFSNIDFIPTESLDKYSKHRLFENDLVIATVGSHPGLINSAAGRAVIIPKIAEGYLLNQNAVCIRTSDPQVLDQRYLAYVGKTHSFQHYIQQRGKGAANQMRIAIEAIKAYETEIPDLPIQHRIAEVLGRYDCLIENCRQQIVILEASAQALYREWFVRGRCPHAQPQKGALPVGWRLGTLREVIQYYIGGGWGNDDTDSDFSVGGFVIRGTDIPQLRRGQINPDVYRFHKASNIKSREIKAGDIVFEVAGGSKEQPLGRNVLITSDLLRQYGDRVICASFCKQIRVDEKVMSPFYLQQLFDHLLETEEMGQFEVQSTGISNFQFEDFLDFQPVLLPSKNDLDKFDSIVEPIYRKIGLLGLQTSQLKQMRDKLLPRLMSRKIPLTATE